MAGGVESATDEQEGGPPFRGTIADASDPGGGGSVVPGWYAVLWLEPPPPTGACCGRSADGNGGGGDCGSPGRRRRRLRSGLWWCYRTTCWPGCWATKESVWTLGSPARERAIPPCVD